MPAPYAKRRINVTFRLGKGSFGDSGFNTTKLEGLRVQAVVENGGLPNPHSAVVLIFGMTLDKINELTLASLNWKERQNSIMIEAGDDTGMTTIFNGQFFKATPLFNSGPDTAFQVLANAGYGIQMDPVKPVSMQGGNDVDAVLNRILQPTGYKLQNIGVKATLSNPYFPGTAMEQINAVLRAVGCLGSLDSVAQVLRIWPNGESAGVGQTPTISPATGMIGYPEFDFNTVTVRSTFDPSLRGPVDSAAGKLIKLESQIPAANGLWTVMQINYHLTSETPDGPWEMEIKAYRDPKTQAAKNAGDVAHPAATQQAA